MHLKFEPELVPQSPEFAHGFGEHGLSINEF